MSLASKLSRTISSSVVNEAIISQVRDIIRNDIIANQSGDHHVRESSGYTFSLPAILDSPSELQTALYDRLIDHDTLASLELTKHLNWWTNDAGICRRFYPMTTSGDGNCLLHAASLAMWGFHDRRLELRQALHSAMFGHGGGACKRRWRHQTQLMNLECGLELSEEEWEKEWNYVVNIASTKPKQRCVKTNQETANNRQDISGGHATPTTAGSNLGGGHTTASSILTYESLEEIHVYILCNILCRPILVVSKTFLTDAHGQPLAPIPFGGIYLPLERNPADCQRTPLLLTYDNGHFCALVPMEGDTDGQRLGLADAIPLTDNHLELLPIHFNHDPSNGCNKTSVSSFQINPISSNGCNDANEPSIHIAQFNADPSSGCNDINVSLTHPTLTREDKLDLINRYIDNVELTLKSPSGSTSEVSPSPLPNTPVLCAALQHERAYYVKDMILNFYKTGTGNEQNCNVADKKSNENPSCNIVRRAEGIPSSFVHVSMVGKENNKAAAPLPTQSKISSAHVTPVISEAKTTSSFLVPKKPKKSFLDRFRSKKSSPTPPTRVETAVLADRVVLCKAIGCRASAEAELNFMCSGCHAKSVKSTAGVKRLAN